MNSCQNFDKILVQILHEGETIIARNLSRLAHLFVKIHAALIMGHQEKKHLASHAESN